MGEIDIRKQIYSERENIEKHTKEIKKSYFLDHTHFLSLPSILVTMSNKALITIIAVLIMTEIVYSLEAFSISISGSVNQNPRLRDIVRTSRGTLFVSDGNCDEGISNLHRSIDNGKTWDTWNRFLFRNPKCHFPLSADPDPNIIHMAVGNSYIMYNISNGVFNTINITETIVQQNETLGNITINVSLYPYEIMRSMNDTIFILFRTSNINSSEIWSASINNISNWTKVVDTGDLISTSHSISYNAFMTQTSDTTLHLLIMNQFYDSNLSVFLEKGFIGYTKINADGTVIKSVVTNSTGTSDFHFIQRDGYQNVIDVISDDEDNLHVVWSNLENGYFVLYYAKKPNGQNWAIQPLINLTSINQDAAWGKIRWDNDQKILYVIFMQEKFVCVSRSTCKYGFFVTSTDRGETWNTTLNQYGDGTYVFNTPEIRGKFWWIPGDQLNFTDRDIIDIIHTGNSDTVFEQIPMKLNTLEFREIDFCGDNLLQISIGEQCDDGNTNNSDGCNAQCHLEVCGDGIKQPNEQCDDGASNNLTSGCTNVCTLTFCGDGIVQSQNGVNQNEQCDDGNANNNDGCSSICKFEIFCRTRLVECIQSCGADTDCVTACHTEFSLCVNEIPNSKMHNHSMSMAGTLKIDGFRYSNLYVRGNSRIVFGDIGDSDNDSFVDIPTEMLQLDLVGTGNL